MYRFERAANCRELLDNVSLWDSLAGDWPLRLAAWLGTWWDHFGDLDRSFFIVARDDNDSVRGILPLYRETPHRNLLRFVGQGLACSDGLSVLSAAHDAESIGFEMGYWFATHRDCAKQWQLMDLDGVIAGDQGMIAFAKGLSAGGASIHVQSRMHTWFKPVTDSWEDYLSSLSKPRRRSTKKLAAKIDETPSLSRHVSVDQTELRSDLDAMIDLHQRRWNALGQPGSFADPLFREFIHDSASRFMRCGRLRMQSLRLDGEVIAGELQMSGVDGALTVYSTGMNTQFAALEPGRIMSIETIRHAYQNALPGIDYLRGDEPYKAQLGAEPRRIARLRVVPGTAWGRLHHAAWKGAFELKQWARRRKGSEPIVVLPSLATGTVAPPLLAE